MRALEEAPVLPVGAREAALLVPEQLALDEVWARSRRSSRQERPLPATDQVVDRLRGQFLAGAALAHQQHGRGGRRHPIELIVQSFCMTGEPPIM